MNAIATTRTTESIDTKLEGIKASAQAAASVLTDRVNEPAKNDVGPKRGDEDGTGFFIGERKGVRWYAQYRVDLPELYAAFDAPRPLPVLSPIDRAVAEFGGPDALLSLNFERAVDRAMNESRMTTLPQACIAHILALHAQHGWTLKAPTTAALMHALGVAIAKVPRSFFGEPSEHDQATAAIDDEGRVALLVCDDGDEDYIGRMKIFAVGVALLAQMAPQLYGLTLSHVAIHDIAASGIDAIGRMAFIPLRIAHEATHHCTAAEGAEKIRALVDLPRAEIEKALRNWDDGANALYGMEDFHVGVVLALASKISRLAGLPFLMENNAASISIYTNPPAGEPREDLLDLRYVGEVA